MNLKKMIVTGLTGAIFLVGCGQAGMSTEQSSNLDNESVSSEAIQSSDIAESNQEENTILYKGTVAAQEETSDESILVNDLTPINNDEAAPFDEVLLLMNESIPLTDKQTGEELQVMDVHEGDMVEVTLVENAPTTMSIPPQIPGNGIIKVEVEPQK